MPSTSMTPAASVGLTTVATIKVILGITGSDDDAQYEQLRIVAESAIKEQSTRVLQETAFTEYYSGNGGRRLVLRRRPVQSITNLWLDSGGYFGKGSGAFAAAKLLVEGTDYVLDEDVGDGGDVVSRSGIVHRINNVWPNATGERLGLLTHGPINPLGNIKVQYVAGYASTPGFVTGGIAQMVAQLKSNAEANGRPITSESFDYYSYTTAGQAEVAQALSGVEGLLAPILKTKTLII